MKYKMYLVLFLCGLMFNAFSQKKDETIKWRSIDQLTWGDFKARAKRSSSYSALTASGISPSMQYENGKLEIEVLSYFIPKDSWVKKDKKKDGLLIHEQGHFNITEIYRRKFIQELQKANFTEKNIQKLFNKTFDKVYARLTKYQGAYDKETNHSMNAEKQKIWDNKIAEELNSLKKYAIIKVIIEI
jgi:hypothetical protein